MKSCEKNVLLKIIQTHYLNKNCDITMLKEMVVEDAQF